MFFNNQMRITGLASPFDVEQMVSDIMKGQRVRLDKLEQDKQVNTWKQEIYNDLNKEFANFILDTKKEFGLTATTSTGVLLSKTVNSLSWVRSAQVSNENLAAAEANANALNGTYSVSVTNLAKNFAVASTADLGSLGTLKNQFSLADDDIIKFTIAHSDGSAKTFEYSGINLHKNILDIVKDINNAGLGVKATYDANINRFFLQTIGTGEANGFTITEETEATVDFLTGADNKLKLNLTSGVENKGQDALLSFNGADNIKMSSNEVTINNLNLKLKGEGDFSVTVGTDVDGVYDKISKFVEKYNELIGKLNGELGEKRYRSHLPLTAEQREAMSEKEIGLWEEKAKSGLIRYDGLIDNTLLSMRRGFYDQVVGTSGSYNQITQIGLETEAWASGSKGGRLVIKETELKQAILDDVDGVLELLFKEPSSELKYKTESKMTASEVAQKRSESGLISRLYDNIVAGMKNVVVKVGAGNNADLYRNVNSSIMVDFIADHSGISMMDKNNLDLDKRIVNVTEYLAKVENKYWKQFTAMEKALKQMDAQSSWMMQQFGGGQ